MLDLGRRCHVHLNVPLVVSSSFTSQCLICVVHLHELDFLNGPCVFVALTKLEVHHRHVHRRQRDDVRERGAVGVPANITTRAQQRHARARTQRDNRAAAQALRAQRDSMRTAGTIGRAVSMAMRTGNKSRYLQGDLCF